MIKRYVYSMIDFAKKKSNVHKELKDTLVNMGLLMKQYVKVKNLSSKVKETDSTCTQTEEAPVDKVQSANNQRKKARTTDVSTDTPCWWPMFLERESISTFQKDLGANQSHRQQPQQLEEENEQGKEYTVVNRKRLAKKRTNSFVSKENKETDKRERQHPIRKQAVILKQPTGNASHADMVRQVKKTVHDENLTYKITTRRAKSGNIILEIPNKEQTDSLAELLKTRIGETISIRRPSPTIPLFLMGIEDSVEETELRGALEIFDSELKGIKNVVIRESRSGLRTAVIHAPLRAGRRLIEEKRIKIGWECAGSKNLMLGSWHVTNIVKKGIPLKIAPDLRRENVSDAEK